MNRSQACAGPASSIQDADRKKADRGRIHPSHIKGQARPVCSGSKQDPVLTGPGRWPPNPGAQRWTGEFTAGAGVPSSGRKTSVSTFRDIPAATGAD